MKKIDKVFAKVYNIDQNTNACLIEIALARYDDIFNKWDFDPFERREVNPELEDFLERCSDEIPFRYPIEFHFTIPEGMRNRQKEEKSRDGFKNHFTFKIYLVKNKLKINYRRTLYCFLVGFFLLAGGIQWQIVSQNLLPSILRESLNIGGWVFIWQAVSVFSFGNTELYRSYRTYKRLRNAPIIFHEAKES